MKTAQIKKAYWSILETVDASTLVNGYYGASNLLANHLNDYSSNGMSQFIAEWIEENVNVNDIGELSVFDIVESPSTLIRYSSIEFFYAFCELFNVPSTSDGMPEVERIFKDCKKHFDAWGSYYLFGRQWSNACCDYWLIRADSDSEAFEWLTYKFESDFIVDEEDVDEEGVDKELNSNGNVINTDNLVLIGIIEGAQK